MIEWSKLLNYDVFVDVIIPLLAALVGGVITMCGVVRTIKFERRNTHDQAIQAAKPWIFSLNPIEDYDCKNAPELVMKTSDELDVQANFQIIIKNTDNAIGVIEKVQTKNNTYWPEVGRILDKNRVVHLNILLGSNENLQDMFLYVNDIYGNTYKYKVTQRDKYRKGNHIEEVQFIPVAKRKKATLVKKGRSEKCSPQVAVVKSKDKLAKRSKKERMYNKAPKEG